MKLVPLLTGISIRTCRRSGWCRVAGTLYCNHLTDWVRGARSGALSCTHAYDLRRVPAGPLA